MRWLKFSARTKNLINSIRGRKKIEEIIRRLIQTDVGREHEKRVIKRT